MAVAAMGLVPMSPVTAVAPVLVMPVLDRIAKFPAVPSRAIPPGSTVTQKSVPGRHWERTGAVTHARSVSATILPTKEWAREVGCVAAAGARG